MARPEATDTKQAILDAAETCFAEHGFSGASVKMIADACGQKVPNIIHHFGTKHDLFCAMLDRVFTPFVEMPELSDRAVDNVRLFVTGFAEFSYANPLIHRLIVTEQHAPERLAHMLTFMRPILGAVAEEMARAQEAGDLPPGDPIVKIYAIIGTLGSLASNEPEQRGVFGDWKRPDAKAAAAEVMALIGAAPD
ncbi:MAG: TetR/AcrR family transcriptional regulator [Pseudomonadota bacterium]